MKKVIHVDIGGMPHSGKTTVGRLIAAVLAEAGFTDVTLKTDSIPAVTAPKSIAEIIAEIKERSPNYEPASVVITEKY